MQRRRLLVALRVGAQLLALAFVVWTGFRVARGWRGMPAAVPVQAIALAAAASLASNVIQAVAWREQIEFASGRKLPWHVHLRVFLASNLGRYMPGKVGLPAIRIAGLVSFGLRPVLVTAAILLEVASWLLTAAIVAFAVLAFAPPAALPASLSALQPWGRWPALGACIASTLVLAALLLIDRRRLPARLLGAGGLLPTGPLLTPSMPLLHLLYWGAWCAHGVALVMGFGASAVGAIGASAAFVLAPVIGFLAFLAPAGAGVREAVLISLVAPVTGVENSVAIGLLSRALSLSGDVVAWLASLGLDRWARTRSPVDAA